VVVVVGGARGEKDQDGSRGTGREVLVAVVVVVRGASRGGSRWSVVVKEGQHNNQLK
jgi:hypothetical protein